MPIERDLPSPARRPGSAASVAPAPHGLDTGEKVAYLTGLASGLGTDGEPAQTGPILSGVLSVLADLARDVARVRRAQAELADRLAAVDGRMAELADEMFGVPEGTALIHCEACGQAMHTARADLEDDRIELVCPNCGRVVHGYDSGLDLDEDEDELTDGPQ